MRNYYKKISWFYCLLFTVLVFGQFVSVPTARAGTSLDVYVCPTYDPGFTEFSANYKDLVARMDYGVLNTLQGSYTSVRLESTNSSSCTKGFKKTVAITAPAASSMDFVINITATPVAGGDSINIYNGNTIKTYADIELKLWDGIIKPTLKSTGKISGPIPDYNVPGINKIAGTFVDDTGDKNIITGVQYSIYSIKNNRQTQVVTATSRDGYFSSSDAGSLSDGAYKVVVDEKTNAQFWIDWYEKLPAVQTYYFLKCVTGDPKQCITDTLNEKEMRLVGSADVMIAGGSVTDVEVELTVVTVSELDKAMAGAINTFGSWVQESLKWVMNQVRGLLESTTDYVIGQVGCNPDLGECGMLGPWTIMRNIGLTLLVMALIIIAFANVLQVDIEQYGLNRMIPKIIISIILAFMSWIIVTFFFDLTKAFQDQAVTLLNSGGGYGGLEFVKTMSVSPSTPGSVMTNVGATLLLLVILVGVLVAGVVLLFTLVLRIVMLSFLLAVAPLAFILNVVPFTSNLYKQWWSEFWKWMFMGPIALVIISLGAVIASSATKSPTGGGFGSTVTLDPLLVNSSTDSSGRMLIGLIIFAGAMYMGATLPMKWGGNIMKGWSGIGKKAWGKTGGAIGKFAGAQAKQAWGNSRFMGAAKLYGKKWDYNRNKKAQLRGNQMAQDLSGGGIGMDQQALMNSIEDAEAQEQKKQLVSANVGKDHLKAIAMSAKGPKALAAWQLMAEKDWMDDAYVAPGAPVGTPGVSMYEKMYQDVGLERGDNINASNRKKNLHHNTAINAARGAAAPANPAFDTAAVTSKLTQSEYSDVNKKAWSGSAFTRNARITTDTAAGSIKSEQIDSLLGTAGAAGTSVDTTRARTLTHLDTAVGPAGQTARSMISTSLKADDANGISAGIAAFKAAIGAGAGTALGDMDDRSIATLIKNGKI